MATTLLTYTFIPTYKFESQMKKWTVISIILVTILLGSTSFWFGATEKINLVEKSSLTLTPDFFLQNVIATRFNQTGKIVEKTEAAELKHYETTKQSTLIHPKITKYQQNNIWELNSSSGNILDGSKNITLTDQVRAVKAPKSNNKTTILADLMRYTDNKKTLIGEGNTSIQSIQGIIKADKITAFIDTDKIEIEGSVRGLYETKN